MGRVRGILRAWHAEQSELAEKARAATGLSVAFPFQLYSNAYLHKLFQLVYIVCKTRGYKGVVKLFPHEVADLEPALQCLVCQVRGGGEGNRGASVAWREGEWGEGERTGGACSGDSGRGRR